MSAAQQAACARSGRNAVALTAVHPLVRSVVGIIITARQAIIAFGSAAFNNAARLTTAAGSAAGRTTRTKNHLQPKLLLQAVVQRQPLEPVPQVLGNQWYMSTTIHT